MNIDATSSSGRLRIALVGLWGAALLAALVGLGVYQFRAGVAGEPREPQLVQLSRLLERETAGAADVPAAPWPPLQRPGPVYGCALREEQQ